MLLRKYQFPHLFQSLFLYLIGIILVFGFGLFIWGSDKSFDFTDEGLYLLVYQNPHEFPDSYTSYHRVGAVVSQLVGGNIIALRLIGFFLTGLATFYFSTSLIWFVKGRGLPLFENSPERTFLHLALQGSVLSAYCWLPPTLNYNTMVGIGMLLSCGGILSFFACPNSRHLVGQAFAGVLAMGSGLLLAFLAKGSSAVGIIVISIFLLGMCSLVSVREKVIFVAVASVVVLGGGLCIFLLMPSLFVSWEFLLGSIVALTEGNGAREIILRHWQESMEFAMRHFRSFLLPIILALGVGIFSRVHFFKKLRDHRNALIVWLVLGVFICEVILLVVRGAFMGGFIGRKNSLYGYSSLFLVILTLRAVIPGFSNSISPFKIFGFLFFLLWLAILPFVTAAGTTHKIFINALLHTAPLSAAILLLASSLDKDFRKSVVVPIASLIIVGLAFSQFMTGFILFPGRTGPKWTQTVPVEVGVPGTFLKLDPASADCIEKTKTALRASGFKPGDDILALYGLPGLVYAVGGVSPQRPWFFVYGTLGHEENLGALQRIPHTRLQKSYIFLNDKNDWAISQLASCGVSLMKEWQPIGQAVIPFKTQKVEILKPLNIESRKL
jgi:hypothetical protein